MKNFESKELEKTFDEIIFAQGVSKSEEGLSQSSKNPHTNSESSQNKLADVHIEKVENGISVEELYANPTSFSSKEVIVRGKVVKVNNGILDRNWVHIIDGTAHEDKQNLTITTSSKVKVGDTLTFKATVVLDKDFGSGYVYPLLLENGAIVE